MNQELKNLQYEIEEMNLLRNLRSWKHNTVKLSEESVVKTLKKENVELVESIAKYKKQL
jgi:NTP pyrophosphatase (non-canonical NTP hydrolase)